MHNTKGDLTAAYSALKNADFSEEAALINLRNEEASKIPSPEVTDDEATTVDDMSMDVVLQNLKERMTQEQAEAFTDLGLTFAGYQVSNWAILQAMSWQQWEYKRTKHELSQSNVLATPNFKSSKKYINDEIQIRKLLKYLMEPSATLESAMDKQQVEMFQQASTPKVLIQSSSTPEKPATVVGTVVKPAGAIAKTTRRGLDFAARTAREKQEEVIAQAIAREKVDFFDHLGNVTFIMLHNDNDFKERNKCKPPRMLIISELIEADFDAAAAAPHVESKYKAWLRDVS